MLDKFPKRMVYLGSMAYLKQTRLGMGRYEIDDGKPHPDRVWLSLNDIDRMRAEGQITVLHD